MKKKYIPDSIPTTPITSKPHLFVLLLGAISLCFFLLVTLPFFDSSVATDAENFNHWVKTNFRFGDSALDNSVVSPFQSLGGLAQPLAVRIHIPYLAAYLLSPERLPPPLVPAGTKHL
jgi:hypothetical protein